MVMEALDALHSYMDKLKEQRILGPSCGVDDAVAPDSVSIGPAGQEVSPSSLPVGSSGFIPAEHCISSDDSDSQDDVQPDSVLLICTRVYGPVDEVSAGIDKHVTAMVNHVFDNSLREEEYKEILDDVATKSPGNCHALAPVDCNSQVLDALRTDAKKSDFHMKDAGKDIIKTATILTKSLTVLAKIAQTGLPDIAHEVDMLNGALALLGNANHKNNLAHQFIIKCEIN
ncbi:hypothetical protein E2C01_060430 [Portunus trituberculatus]|uniref:Uncharacterized protein n=1 Tax=Portunus trituberculatus TaxID=210409 RepID=A0A5B7H811_PORTR|nr:hypothetical protein [Portunus trituberculatus]